MRLKFTPNPAYTPPSHVEQVLEGMQGELLIDRKPAPRAHRRHTFQESLSGGESRPARQGRTLPGAAGGLGLGRRLHGASPRCSLNITGKILMFKSLSMCRTRVFSDFQRVPDNLTFAQGVQMLKTEAGKTGAQ